MSKLPLAILEAAEELDFDFATFSKIKNILVAIDCFKMKTANHE